MNHGKPLPPKSKEDQEDKYRGIWRPGLDKVSARQDCLIKDECGTCVYINTDYERSLDKKYRECIEKFKTAELLARCRFVAPKPSPMPLFYRTHAKMAVRPATATDRRFDIGLFKRGTHEVVNLDFCPLHKDSITQVLKSLRPLLESSEMTPYEEASGQGELRYIAIRASHLTDEVMITFVVTKDCARNLKSIVQELKNQGNHIASAHMNINTSVGNNIFGDDSRRLLGADRIRENLCGLQFEIGPTSFFQVNPWQAEHIYRRVEQLAGSMPRGATAWDLYCGTGTLSTLLARSGYRTLGIEENPQATRDAEANVRRNELSSAPQFMAGRVEDLVDHLPTWATEPSIIVANPSRRGMAEQALRTVGLSLKQKDNTMFLYVSCEADTLIRDIKALEKFGLNLRQLEAFDMFPFTEKLEWIAVLT